MATTFTATYTLTARDETATAEGFTTYAAAEAWIRDSLDYWASMWGNSFAHTADIIES